MAGSVNCYLAGHDVTGERDFEHWWRTHRKNIFNPSFNFAGAAFGRHGLFGTVCSMDFAGSYPERGRSPVETLVARNF